MNIETLLRALTKCQDDISKGRCGSVGLISPYENKLKKRERQIDVFGQGIIRKFERLYFKWSMAENRAGWQGFDVFHFKRKLQVIFDLHSTEAVDEFLDRKFLDKTNRKYDLIEETRKRYLYGTGK